MSAIPKSRRDRAIDALVTLGGKEGRKFRDRHGDVALVHSPARPPGHPDVDPSVYVYPSGFYKDFGGYETYWAKWGLPSAGTLEQIETAAGLNTKPSFENVWKEVFPAHGKSLDFIKERALNAEFVGGDNEKVYFPIRAVGKELIGIQTRTILGKEYRVVEGSNRDGCFHPEGLEYDTIYLTEGATDTFSLASFLPNVVGVVSCSWLSVLERLPKNRTYISLLDNDEAGYAANEKLVNILPTQFVDFSGRKDVNEWILKEPKKLLSLLSTSARATTPFYNQNQILLQQEQTGQISSQLISIQEIGSLDGIVDQLQSVQLSPLLLKDLPTSIKITYLDGVEQTRSGIPILISDISRSFASWLAYKNKTRVYVLEQIPW